MTTGKNSEYTESQSAQVTIVEEWGGAPAAKLVPGQILCNRYELKEPLGHGGMGEVWKAYDKTEEKEYALKFVLWKGTDPSAYTKALKSAKIAYKKVSELSHPSICIPKHSDEDPVCGYFFVMPLLCGESLKEYRDQVRAEGKKIPISQIFSILHSVAEGLDYLHRQGLVHQDVKPQNIMLTKTEKGTIKAKLIDFGLVATLHYEESVLSSLGIVGGTKAFMSPEQQEWRPRGMVPNHLSDQFSLALVAYQLLNGALPKMKCAPAPVEGASVEANQVFKKALSYQPSERFSHCVEFVENLQKSWNQSIPHSVLKTRFVTEPLTSGYLKICEVNGLFYRFHWCPPGSFQMGSPLGEKGRWKDELLHQVTLTQGFWLLETPVTQEMWESVLGTSLTDQKNKAEDANGKPRGTYFLLGKGNAYPMYDVSWKECQIFCEKLSAQMGQKISLPTEAQWEYA